MYYTKRSLFAGLLDITLSIKLIPPCRNERGEVVGSAFRNGSLISSTLSACGVLSVISQRIYSDEVRIVRAQWRFRRAEAERVTGSNFSNVLAIKQYIITSRRLRQQGRNKRRIRRRTGEEMNFWCENRRKAGEESDRRQTKRRTDGQADRRTNGRADRRTKRGTGEEEREASHCDSLAVCQRVTDGWIRFLSSLSPPRTFFPRLFRYLVLYDSSASPEQPALKASSYSIRIRDIQDVDLRLPQVMIQIFRIDRC